MNTRHRTPPSNLTALKARLNNIAGPNDSHLVARTLACVIVGQLIPAGAIKGGTALRVHFGLEATRASRDLDVTTDADREVFIEDLQRRLRVGWNGFTGRVLARRGPRPAGIPPTYVMSPYDLKMDFRGQSWLTVPLELGRDEIGDTERPVDVMAESISVIFEALGFPRPRPVPVLAREDQVAQKLHACSASGSDRAHDLVDLQLLSGDPSALDLGMTLELCTRLFRSRRSHPWPPTVVVGPGWPTLYAEAADGLGVIPDVDSAVRWVNGLIADIDASQVN
ncbi:nucleotidyl transferase AbiEii/AbiGii toxin family protein [Nakamurella alba]|uniref:nucleotidyl transferase AbiEii/AbiGii toxin family protein n=1 Tax=Nakamurella alba TaxID=2665158 RepID=UPI0018AC4803|nr:nucleotidyl transferase AbiEii/AbiGii toxin family protein [Nakamurella alba]